MIHRHRHTYELGSDSNTGNTHTHSFAATATRTHTHTHTDKHTGVLTSIRSRRGWYLPGVPVAVHLGSNGVHDVLLALDALLPPLYLLYVLLPLIVAQLPIPLPEGSAVCAHLHFIHSLVGHMPLTWRQVYKFLSSSV